MTTPPNDGGPAFPIPPVGTGDPRDGMSQGCDGMSLRDWFAGQALAGLITASEGWDPDHYALLSYQVAAAMLAERNKEKA